MRPTTTYYRRPNSSFSRFLQYLLVMLNFFVLITGFGALAIGIWIVVDKKPYEYIVGSNIYSSAACLLMAAGIITFCLAFVGCFAAVKHFRCLLTVYFACSVAVFLMAIISGSLGFLLRDKLEANLKDSMTSSMTDYYGDKNHANNVKVTKAWDHMQATLSCCSVGSAGSNQTDFHRWFKTFWYRSQTGYPKDRIPSSCCSKCKDLRSRGYCDKSQLFDERRSFICDVECPEESEKYVNLALCQGKVRLQWPSPVYINYEGCYPKLMKEIRSTAVTLGAVSTGLAVFLVLAMICTLCFMRSNRERN